jgi:hypothetical protein
MRHCACEQMWKCRVGDVDMLTSAVNVNSKLSLHSLTALRSRRPQTANQMLWQIDTDMENCGLVTKAA